jgi:hypothetical protein
MTLGRSIFEKAKLPLSKPPFLAKQLNSLIKDIMYHPSPPLFNVESPLQKTLAKNLICETGLA